MSKLQELIDRLCPDGVEFGKLGDYIDIYTGSQFNKRDMNDAGSYPVINGGVNASGYIESFNEEAKTITISQGGASAGYVAWQETPFWAGAHCYVVRPSSSAVLNRFLYFFLKNQEVYLQQMQHGAGIPALNRDKVKSLLFPLVPIEVQEEIVKILDRFADYAAELQAELQARRLQYEYYRNLLLTFNPSAYGCGTDDAQKISVIARGGHSYEIQWKTMGEVCDFVNGFAFKSNLFRSKGERIIRITNITGSNVDVMDSKYFELNDYSTDLSKYRVQKGNILIAMSGATTGKIGCYNSNENSYINQRVGMFKPHDELSERFLFHFLSTITTELYILAGGGAQPNLSSNQLMSDVRIPIPPLEVQEKIVAILDRFETLVNDLSKGLPAEIEAVKARYEYYRNKLLTFNPLSA